MKNRGVVLLSAFFLLFGFLYSGQVEAREGDPPVKRLKRLPSLPWPYNYIDAHRCMKEIQFRQDDFLAALTEKEVGAYLKEAEGGNADAMYLLSQIPKERPDGTREYPYADWLAKADAAGHPIAQYLVAKAAYDKLETIEDIAYWGQRFPDLAYLSALIEQERTGKAIDIPIPEKILPFLKENQARAKELTAPDAYTGKSLTAAQFLAIAERAAHAQGNGEIAWRLAFAYSNALSKNSIYREVRGWRHPFLFLPEDPPKALYWTRVAAGKGNMAAAEDLCNTYSFKSGNPKLGTKHDPAEAVRWCTVAAQANCSTLGALVLARLYREGIGVAPSKLDSLYWEKVYEEREKQGSANGWEY